MRASDWPFPELCFSEKLRDAVVLFFREPHQLLSIFTDLEDENLRLIQECQEAEDKAEEVRKRTSSVSVESSLQPYSDYKSISLYIRRQSLG